MEAFWAVVTLIVARLARWSFAKEAIWGFIALIVTSLAYGHESPGHGQWGWWGALAAFGAVLWARLWIGMKLEQLQELLAKRAEEQRDRKEAALDEMAERIAAKLGRKGHD